MDGATLGGALNRPLGALVAKPDGITIDGSGVLDCRALVEQPGRKITAATPRARIAMTAMAVSTPSRRFPPPSLDCGGGGAAP